MADLDHLFSDLRADVAASASGPPVPELAARSRRRTRDRVAAVTVAAAVLAVGAFAVQGGGGDDAQPPVLISPTPSATTPAEPSTKGVLAHEEAAMRNTEGANDRWVLTDDVTGIVEVPACTNAEPTVITEPRLVPGTRVERTLGFFHTPVDGSSYRYEQLLLSQTEEAARRQFSGLIAGARECLPDKETTYDLVSVPELGDEAWLITSKYHGSEYDPSNLQTLLVRQGPAIVIYLDRQDPEIGAALATAEQHESDARKVVARLCDRGFGC